MPVTPELLIDNATVGVAPHTKDEVLELIVKAEPRVTGIATGT